MPLVTDSQTRKERRKQDRKKRKRHLPSKHEERKADSENENNNHHHNQENEAPKSKKKRKKTSKQKGDIKTVESGDPFSRLGADIIDSIRRDDEEINALESKLGLKNGKSKEKLNKEYAKLEGYGDDFGSFLDDLDGLVERISRKSGEVDEIESDDDEMSISKQNSNSRDTALMTETRPNKQHLFIEKYDPISSAGTTEREDAEIADLEKKLGLGKEKDKSKLRKEYQAEGYGDDFGDFLDGLDNMIHRVNDPNSSEYLKANRSDESFSGSEEQSHSDAHSEASEELVPMKDPDYGDLDEDDSVLDELESSDILENHDDYHSKVNGAQKSEMASESNSEADSESEESEADHDIADVYHPSQGEDIYGNLIDKSSPKQASKYVPPHLRNKPSNQRDDTENEEKMRLIRRNLNNVLNRLSDDTLVSVAQQLSQLYEQFPTQLVHLMLWKNVKNACVDSPILMIGMVPTYIACIVGAHIQSNDTVQLGEYFLEAVTTELLAELDAFRNRKQDDAEDLSTEIVSKHICNRMLVLCYLYNFGMVHCSFIYDIVRHLIGEFSHIDIECLLLLLSHSGRSLRSDDPLALKEIVLLVHKKKSSNPGKVSSSRAEYMVAAITDLKNNKRGKQDTAYGEKSAKLRKTIGQVKSIAAKSNTAKSTSEVSLRISLDDVLNADTKGRWWKVGASWVGNQYRYTEDGQKLEGTEISGVGSSIAKQNDEKLMKLAAKFRMNTDRKRAIFCIVMGSEDCEDAFEKLCRGSMLSNRSERDCCRVLLECCLNEKSYNKFYGHLASRICEFQPQCKFSLQLAFWDTFKQFEGMDTRKAVNLAKFLFHLAINQQLLRLMTVIKAIDMSEDDTDETTLVFLTVLMSNILDHFDDTSQIKAIFGVRQSENVDESRQEQEEGARAGLLVFFMETLKASPKNVKGSKFRKNFKAAVKALDSDGFQDMF